MCGVCVCVCVSKTSNTYYVLTVTFVEFLVLTSVVWEPREEKQELQLVDVHGQAGYSGEAYGIGIMGGTGVNPCGAPVDVHLSLPGWWTIPDRVHSRGNWAQVLCWRIQDKVELSE